MASKEQNLEQAILLEKEKGTPDIEIGRKFGVTYKYIEKVITKAKGINVSGFKDLKKIKILHPKDFIEEQTTVWSFKQRGNWATHSGEYRGNWSPYIPRNVILKYSKPGEIVLDYFCGAGTTAVESKLLGRRCIALDINEKAIELARRNLNFSVTPLQLRLVDKDNQYEIYEPEVMVGDARNLSFLQNNSIDLICSHPPYANIIQYTNSNESDLSHLNIDDFLTEMKKVAEESFRVLKPGRQCVILIGDMRKHKYVVPLGFKLIDVYLKAGFKLRELVIKRQHNCKTTGFWYTNSIKYNFLLLAHEYLPIFEKPFTPITIKEDAFVYTSLKPKFVKPVLKKQLKELETTTVWIFPQDDFEKNLDTNIIERYWTSDGYVTISLSANGGSSQNLARTKKKLRNSLVYIKAKIPHIESSNWDTDKYLEEIKNIVERELNSLNKGGIIAILINDIRKDNYLLPLGKLITDIIKFNNLLLKEIVIVTTENHKVDLDYKANQFLEITHYYLLIYEKKK
ncbi:MAG: DNA methyltransferase [candidate division WOR-3 bacterium]